MVSVNKKYTKFELGLETRRVTLKEVAQWLENKHAGITFGDSSFYVRIHPYELRQLKEGSMP